MACLIVDLLLMNGVPASSIFRERGLELPGYFRPTKEWDLLVVHQHRLLAVIEVKSQVGPSFSNNLNNRCEEAVGSSQDLWTACRDGAFGPSRQPWLGYLFLLEDSAASRAPVTVAEPHFATFPEFRNASYARRYEEMCRRLVRERLYTDAALLMSSRDDFGGASLSEPAPDLTLLPFLQSMLVAVRIGMTADH